MGELLKDDLHDVLRTAAAEHQPDRAAMFDRIAQQRFAQACPVGPLARLRPVAVALAVLTVAVLGGLGAWTSVQLVDRGGDDRETVASAPAQHPTLSIRSGAPIPSTSPRTSSAAQPTHRAPATAVAIPSGSAPEEGFLWSDGSVAPESTDAQGRSNITLKNRQTVTAVEVTIRIARTDGLADAGAWSTMPAANYTVTVHRESGALEYHFELNPGVTLIPGTYVFTAQYDHAAGGRDAAGDAYLATASAGGSHVRVYGNFAPVN